MSLNKVAIIIVNYNNYQDTLSCLRSLQKIYLKGITVDKILVDNGSTDDSINQIRKEFPKINLIVSSKNLGFAGGVNFGLRQAIAKKSDYVLLLNNDTQISEPNLIKKMLSTKADIVSPLIKFKRNNQTLTDYGGRVDYLFARNTHYYRPGRFDYLSGVCLLIKTEVFQKIGLFNEHFFLYYEDADFCLRARQAGFKLTLAKNTSVFHSLSSSANKLGKNKIKILADSQIYFSKKHLPKISFPFYTAYNLYLRFKIL